MAKLYDIDGHLQPDVWQHLADDAPLPASNMDLTVSGARWRAERDALMRRSGRLGVRLDNTDAVDALEDDLHRLALIALNFPVFSDGRAFSQAAALRGRLGFTGELRATGDIQPDQLHYLRRCGFNGFEFAVEPTADVGALLHAFSRSYQPAPGDTPAVASVD